LYSTPSSTSAVVSTITICNQSGSSITYRIGLTSSETNPNISEFLAYGSTVSANDTIALTLGVTMGENKFIRVSSSSASVSFMAFGTEVIQ
jgi:CDP-diglyceride synthetase